MARSYNFIYKSLVNDPNDIVGHVAYSLYKAEKIEFIEAFKKDHDGAEPTDDDLDHFHRSSSVSGSVERYRLSANNMLSVMLENVISNASKEIEQQYYMRQKEMIEEAIKPIKPKGWLTQLGFGAFQSLIGAFLFALLLAAIGFINLFKANDVNISVTSPSQNTQTVITDKQLE